MKTAPDLIAELRSLGASLTVQGGNLRCNAPQGAITPALRMELSASKHDLIQLLETEDGGPSIRPADRERELPLSFAQTRLWFLQQLDGGSSSAYNLSNPLQFKGSLNIEILEEALNKVARRHEALRTSFHRGERGTPVQIIHPEQTVALPVLDLAGLTDGERADEVARLAAVDVIRPFDLTRSPLVRTRILRLGPNSHVLLLNIHHIVFDGWSMGLFMQEWSAFYRAGLAGVSPQLPELPIQYADYAVWQRQRLTGWRLAAEGEYWRRRLEGMPRLELPIARGQSSSANFDGRTEHVRLGAALSLQLRQLSRQAGGTPFMTMLAALAVVLARYSGQHDFGIGAPVANRSRSETEGLIGFFVNILVLRVDLSGNPTFRELLARVRQVTLDAYEHQEMPFEKVVELLHPERTANHSPLFQVMLDWQSAPAGAWDFPGITVEPLPGAPVVGRFDLCLTVEDTSAELRPRWEYNGDLFEPEAIARLAGHLRTVLAAITAEPDKRIDELPLLSATERHQLLFEWNATEKDRRRQPISQRFEAQAALTSTATAIECGDEHWNYDELNRVANRLAHRLRRLGVGRDVLVGICAERSLELIAGLLGILKAGGAYVPMDSLWPAARLSYICQDTGIRVLVTQTKLAGHLPEFSGEVVLLEESRNDEPDENPQTAAETGDIAYVIYTSGSTGEPKGVAVTHGALENFIDYAIETYDISSSDRVLQFASVSFDAAVEEIYPCLATGATLVLRSEEMLVSPKGFWSQCTAWRLTLLDLPTAYWHFLTAEAAAGEVCPSVRLVIIGGERAILEHLRRFRRGFDQMPRPPRLVNTYGPTEATVVATFRELTNLDPEDREVPIGRPIPNTRAYVLDALLRPVPVGVPGELYIGGAGVASGYLNRPQLTAERLVNDPFSGQPGRLYRTGDLVRYRADGCLEFVGRTDEQAKIRGFRVEPGEIEAAIAQHPDVKAAVVLVHEVRPGDLCLVGYTVPAGPPLGATELRRFLKDRVPSYMVPVEWISVDSIPLTPNGKVDRRALPIPDLASRNVEAVDAPRDSLEEELVGMWAEVLGLPTVGIRDTFFDLGGHSLLAFALLAQLQRRFGMAVPLADFFLNATVEEVANLLRQKDRPAANSTLVRLQPHGSRRPLFLVHPGAGSVAVYRELVSFMDPHRPVYGLEADGFEPGQVPLRRIEAMAREYITAVRSVEPQGPYLLAGWCLGGLVAYEMAQQLDAEGQSVAFLGMFDPIVRFGQPHQDRLTLLHGVFVELLGTRFAEDELRHLEPDEALVRAFETARQFHELPDGLDLDRVRRMYAVNCCHEEAAVSYKPAPYSGCVTLFCPRENRDQLSYRHFSGWEELAGRLDTRWVAGSHLTMVHKPHAESLVAVLQSCLANLEAPETSVAGAAKSSSA